MEMGVNPRTFSLQDYAPSEIDIRAQLGRIASSVAFRDALRLTNFLTFIVEASLAGKADRLKAYTIAVEALGRGSDFDPQSDPIVRVEAGRLRQALSRYYAEFGGDDPLLIEVPRGSYVPSFRWRDVQKPAPAEATAAHHTNAKFGTNREAEIRGQRAELRRSIVAFQELQEIQREHIAAMRSTIAHTRQALASSYELLEMSANLPLACPASSTLLPTARLLQRNEIRPADGRQTQRNQQAQGAAAARAGRPGTRGHRGDPADDGDNPPRL